MALLILLIFPIVLAVCSLFISRPRMLGWVTALGQAVGLILSLKLGFNFLASGVPFRSFNIFYLDALSLFFLIVVALISTAAAFYSIGFIAKEVSSGAITQNKARYYYALFNLFILSMIMVTVVDNLGIMWAAIELTTLISAFLVGFYNTKEAVEAAWKYLIICSAGIVLALLGTMLFSYALLFNAGVKSLNWTELLAVAPQLDGNFLKIAFIFILIGYGTKAGLAPLHTWLPDAHSQAVSPASALLSGVLIKTAFYAILRYSMVVNHCVGGVFTGHLFLGFGLLSLAVAAGFVLVQKDIKRLLAYSTIEHIGIIAVGFGIGGRLGTYGALLHIFNHAATKALMFFGAGSIVKKYGTHNMLSIKGVLRSIPFTGIMVLIGLLALLGFPPFSIFFSEIIILGSAFLNGSYLVAGLCMLFLAVIFGALLYHFSQMLFGVKPDGIEVSAEPLTGKLAFVFLLVFVCLAGFAALQMGPFSRLLLEAVKVLKGN